MALSQKQQAAPESKPTAETPAADDTPAAAQTRTPQEIQALFTSTTVEISKTGPKNWTGDKNDALARIMIKATRADADAEFSDELSDIITLIFDPNREAKMRVLKRYAVIEGYNIDATTEGLLDLQTDQGTFSTVLSKTKDPATDQALVVRKTKKNRSGKLKNLFGVE